MTTKIIYPAPPRGLPFFKPGAYTQVAPSGKLGKPEALPQYRATQIEAQAGTTYPTTVIEGVVYWDIEAIAKDETLRQQFINDFPETKEAFDQYDSYIKALAASKITGKITGGVANLSGEDVVLPGEEGLSLTDRLAGLPDELKNYYSKIGLVTHLTPEQKVLINDAWGKAKELYPQYKEAYRNWWSLSVEIIRTFFDPYYSPTYQELADWKFPGGPTSTEIIGEGLAHPSTYMYTSGGEAGGITPAYQAILDNPELLKQFNTLYKQIEFAAEQMHSSGNQLVSLQDTLTQLIEPRTGGQVIENEQILKSQEFKDYITELEKQLGEITIATDDVKVFTDPLLSQMIKDDGSFDLIKAVMAKISDSTLNKLGFTDKDIEWAKAMVKVGKTIDISGEITLEDINKAIEAGLLIELRTIGISEESIVQAANYKYLKEHGYLTENPDGTITVDTAKAIADGVPITYLTNIGIEITQQEYIEQGKSLATMKVETPELYQILMVQGVEAYNTEVEKLQKEYDDFVKANPVEIADGYRMTQEDWDNLTPELQTLAKADIKAFNNEVVRLQAEYDELVKTHPIELSNGSRMTQADWDSMTPELQAIAKTEGKTGLDKYFAEQAAILAELKPYGSVIATNVETTPEGGIIASITFEGTEPPISYDIVAALAAGFDKGKLERLFGEKVIADAIKAAAALKELEPYKTKGGYDLTKYLVTDKGKLETLHNAGFDKNTIQQILIAQQIYLSVNKANTLIDSSDLDQRTAFNLLSKLYQVTGQLPSSKDMAGNLKNAVAVLPGLWANLTAAQKQKITTLYSDEQAKLANKIYLEQNFSNFALSMIPIVGTVVFWKGMKPLEKALSIVSDIAFFALPWILPKVAKGVTRLAKGVSKYADEAIKTLNKELAEIRSGLERSYGVARTEEEAIAIQKASAPLLKAFDEYADVLKQTTKTLTKIEDTKLQLGGLKGKLLTAPERARLELTLSKLKNMLTGKQMLPEAEITHLKSLITGLEKIYPESRIVSVSEKAQLNFILDKLTKEYIGLETRLTQTTTKYMDELAKLAKSGLFKGEEAKGIAKLSTLSDDIARLARTVPKDIVSKLKEFVQSAYPQAKNQLKIITEQLKVAETKLSEAIAKHPNLQPSAFIDLQADVVRLQAQKALATFGDMSRLYDQWITAKTALTELDSYVTELKLVIQAGAKDARLIQELNIMKKALVEAKAIEAGLLKQLQGAFKSMGIDIELETLESITKKGVLVTTYRVKPPFAPGRVSTRITPVISTASKLSSALAAELIKAGKVLPSAGAGTSKSIAAATLSSLTRTMTYEQAVKEMLSRGYTPEIIKAIGKPIEEKRAKMAKFPAISPIISPAPYQAPSIKEFPSTQTQTKIRQQAQAQVKSLTRAETKIAESIKPLISPTIIPKTVPASETKPAPKTGTPVKTVTPIKIKPPKPKKPLPKPPSTEGGDNLKAFLVPGSVAWQQGFGFWVIRPPYKDDDRAFFKGKPPVGVIKVVDGAKEAYRSIQMFKGHKPPTRLEIDMGIMSILIKAPSRQPGKRGAIAFTKKRKKSDDKTNRTLASV